MPRTRASRTSSVRDRNVVWKQKVPRGHSSPITWGKRLFLTGVDGGDLVVQSYRRKDGKLLWERKFQMRGEEKFAHVDASEAAPTPVTDGKRLHVYFAAYGLITLTTKGETLWEHPFEFEPSTFGAGASPVLHDGKLFLVRDIAGLSMVHAFDAATGTELWATPRADATRTTRPRSSGATVTARRSSWPARPRCVPTTWRPGSNAGGSRG